MGNPSTTILVLYHIIITPQSTYFWKHYTVCAKNYWAHWPFGPVEGKHWSTGPKQVLLAQINNWHNTMSTKFPHASRVSGRALFTGSIGNWLANGIGPVLILQTDYKKKTPKLVAKFWLPNLVLYQTDYRQVSNIRRTSVGNKIFDHLDLVGASPVGAAPTTSSFSTYHLASLDWAKITARRDEKQLSLVIWCALYMLY